MKLLGHASPEMTMLYLDIALTDLQREFHVARSEPRHLTPQPKTQFASRAGLEGVIDSLLTTQHLPEMFRRTLPDGASRRCLDRVSNRLTKILAIARKLDAPEKWAEIGRISPHIVPNTSQCLAPANPRVARYTARWIENDVSKGSFEQRRQAGTAFPFGGVRTFVPEPERCRSPVTASLTQSGIAWPPALTASITTCIACL